jgi:hypothetical protein
LRLYLWSQLTPMKQLASLFLALLTLTATAQINYPFNPDENADAFISTPDLMEFLVVFGYEWEQEEIQVDSIPLSMYLSSLEAMIEASALPEGTNPGQFLQWSGEAWELVMPKVGCTLPEACNYDPTAHVLFEDLCTLQDECGVCDGPGAIYDCGCSDIPEGECDCQGNVYDAMGICGGGCLADEDGDEICDDVDDCVGDYDECGDCIPVEVWDDEDFWIEYESYWEQYCDCDGNVYDAILVCGGECLADEDGDEICDNEDPCVGMYDQCGICNGPGDIYECGCADYPEGACDCFGNQLDAIGVCGGVCQEDVNNNGICDSEEECAGFEDECNVCFGPGAIYECGCADLPPGDCDCNGNELDAIGVCGGECLSDEDGDGICDIVGCTLEFACNYNPDATVGDIYELCDFTSCLLFGCNDENACNYDPEVNFNDGTCVYPPFEFYDCDGSCNQDLDADGVCDELDDCVGTYDCFGVCNGSGPISGCGCTYEAACNFDPNATVNDGSCDFTSCYGCTDIEACNYAAAAVFDNGACFYADENFDCEGNCLFDTDNDGICDGLEIFGCSDETACNYELDATEPDGTCTYPGCNDELACNFDPEAGCNDGSCVQSEGNSGCTDADACNYQSWFICDDGSCLYLDECGECGGTGMLGCTVPAASNYAATATCDDGSCTIYGCTSEFACNFDPIANTEDASCEFGTCPGCLDLDASNYNPTSTNSDSCVYQTFIAYSGIIEVLTIEESGDYQIQCFGAQGGDSPGVPVWEACAPFGAGQKGAKVTEVVSLDSGDQLMILVGGKGSAAGYSSAGGGGGTYVVLLSDDETPYELEFEWTGDMSFVEPLVVAGGGAGSKNGVAPSIYSESGNCQGGIAGPLDLGREGGAGGGFCSNGEDGYYGEGGVAFLAGGMAVGTGGFGGGGSQWNNACSIAGGGGGWSGGDATDSGTYVQFPDGTVEYYHSGSGGGSFSISGIGIVEPHVQEGNGLVIITLLP